MKALVVLLSIILAVMTIAIVVFFIWGIVIFFRSKCRIGKYSVEGKVAKTIGIVFVIVPACLFGLYALLFEKLNMGASGTSNALIVGPFIIDMLFISGILAIYLWARSRAKKK